MLSLEELLAAFEKRRDSIARGLQMVKETCRRQGGEHLPPEARILFEHSFLNMQKEIDFAAGVIEKLKKGGIESL